MLLKDGVRTDVLDQTPLTDDHLDQLVDDVGGAPDRTFTQGTSLAGKGKPETLLFTGPYQEQPLSARS